ncbi:hypothetical protein [Nocardiopsis ansamitocini]|uniref:Uncharacterized protein n=1 Tax=Nocardiopsis ansamitocini TaxID=1670832 RepID=A0A9W6UI52_9ACTN|nr:hypothetical protein [Nocardiopsis ansamitocini]GLU49576.1 hypothetical protein Nans01_39270 [Nocardiopsis ansamitocini]
MAATAAAVLALSFVAVPAGAVEFSPTPPYVHDTERVERIAAALREDPLFVDIDSAGGLSAAETARIRAALDDQPVPVYAVVVRSSPEDESGGDGDLFLHALHHVMDEDGVYLRIEVPWSRSAEYQGFYTDLAVLGVSLSSYDIKSAADGPPYDVAGIVAVLEEVRTAPEAPVRDELPRAVQRQEEREDEASANPTNPLATGDFWGGLLVIGPLVGALLYGAALLLAFLVRLGLRTAGISLRPPDPRDLDLPAVLRARRRAPRRPSRRTLTALLHTELRALAKAVETASPDTDRERIRTAYDFANLTATTPGASPENLVGAIVVARNGRALTDPDCPPRLPGACMVNPLHGSAPPDSGKHPIPRLGRLAPICAHCLARQGHLASRVLMLDKKPHFATDTVWVTTRYGETVPDLARYALKELDV